MVVKLSEPKAKLKKAFWLFCECKRMPLLLLSRSLILSLFLARSYVRAEQCTEVFIALKKRKGEKKKKPQHMLTSDGCTS